MIKSAPSATEVSPPLVLLGHGTRDPHGRQAFLEFADRFQAYDASRLVIPCFLELTEPLLETGIQQAVDLGYRELTVLPVLLFAARHSKFDITNALDRARHQYPQLQIHYGRHFGVSLQWLTLWQRRLDQVQQRSSIPPEETVLLFVGRGASDPDANGDVYKLARMLWEGSGYRGIEICFTGITHPRLEAGFERIWTWDPRQVIVLPHLLFTGVLVKRIQTVVQQQIERVPTVPIHLLSEIGADPALFELMQEREQEARRGQVIMNCDLCKFRRAASASHGSDHHHHHHDHQTHDHAHDHAHAQDQLAPLLYHGIPDLYPQPEDYHQRAWQIP